MFIKTNNSVRQQPPLTTAPNGLINNIVSRGDLSGKNGETVLINAVPGSKIERILLVGLGENKPLSGKNYKKALLAAVNSLKKPQIKSVVCCLAECDVDRPRLAMEIPAYHRSF